MPQSHCLANTETRWPHRRYLALGRHGDAAAAARLIMEQLPFNPFIQLNALGVLGRALAALGGAENMASALVR